MVVEQYKDGERQRHVHAEMLAILALMSSMPRMLGVCLPVKFWAIRLFHTVAILDWKKKAAAVGRIRCKPAKILNVILFLCYRLISHGSHLG